MFTGERIPDTVKAVGEQGVFYASVAACAVKFIMGRPDGIDNIDMERLIWNLLFNGIESCLRSERERVLDIVIQSGNGVLEIRLENSIPESVLKQNPKL